MRYIIGFFIAIGLIVLIFVLIFRGPSNQTKPQAPADLTQYASTSATMQMTTDGVINADENHRAIRITVGKDETDIDIVKGYQNNVISHHSYPNNESSYATFLRSLQLAGYTKGVTDPNLKDERGVCPNGFRYVYDIYDSSSQQKQHLWTTSCSTGNFKGNTNTVNALFTRQIPDYDNITNNVALSNNIIL